MLLHQFKAILMIGYGSFAPKFIEAQYGLTASRAATLTGYSPRYDHVYLVLMNLLVATKLLINSPVIMIT